MSLTATVINAGIGDLSLGLQMAGFQIAVAFEPDERAAAIHQTNLHNEIIPLSLEQIEPGMLPNVDLLAARSSYPPEAPLFRIKPLPICFTYWNIINPAVSS